MYFYKKRLKPVKVFISWSGEHSNKIAEVLKRWIKHVIQSVEPFVSSEDISKGSRWSADIAKELQDTNFGILCVTKDNFQQPWLLFEAGALSKTLDKSYVVPLLFNLEPSDLSNSPLLQFQATVFSKDEIKKLVDTINEASESKLDTYELDESFDTWYPKLEKSLEEIAANITDKSDKPDDTVTEKPSQVLEEILALSRENQKLLRNSDSYTSGDFGQLVDRVNHLYMQSERNEECPRRRHRISPMMIEDLLHMGRNEKYNGYGLLIILSLFRDDYPWMYDLGRDLLDTLKSRAPIEKKKDATRTFLEMIDFSIHVIKSEKRFNSKEDIYLLRELPMMLDRFISDMI